MFINRDGRVVAPHEAEIVKCNSELTVKYVVRLISDTGYRKEVVAEEDFDNYPNANQIKWCLAKHKKASFAVIEEIYRLKDDLPFY